MMEVAAKRKMANYHEHGQELATTTEVAAKRKMANYHEHKGGTIPKTNEIVKNICSCHNFFPFLLCK